jgi:ferredoxin
MILVGHGGGTIWPHFTAWLDARADEPHDPLDAWSREVIGAIAGRFAARAVFPFDKPWLPFQQWATRAEGLKPSPLGILMHPRFGLWHAYRGALLFDVEIPIQRPANPIHLCDLCAGKDCMNSCPAEAVAVRISMRERARAGCVRGRGTAGRVAVLPGRPVRMTRIAMATRKPASTWRRVCAASKQT